jgi:CheY-like chemotaxis protein
MPAPDDALRDLRILLVEDDPLIRLDLESSLAELGASVTAAADVSRALAALDASAFDFALLDLELSAGTSEPVAEAARTRNVPLSISPGTAKMMSASVSGRESAFSRSLYGRMGLHEGFGTRWRPAARLRNMRVVAR